MTEKYSKFNIVSKGGFGLKVIKPSGKGSVPVALRGAYTSVGLAKRDIDAYQAGQGADKNGKTE